MKCNEDFLKCIRALKSSEHKNYVISYALKKDDTLKFLAYDRINQESIIEVVIGKKTEFNIVQDWDFNISFMILRMDIPWFICHRWSITSYGR